MADLYRAAERLGEGYVIPRGPVAAIHADLQALLRYSGMHDKDRDTIKSIAETIALTLALAGPRTELEF
jgi:hypothetical protein